nr:hypothetical protein [Gemmatimonadota bacterium]
AVHARFADPAIYAEGSHAEIRALEEEAREAAAAVEALVEEWSRVGGAGAKAGDRR